MRKPFIILIAFIGCLLSCGPKIRAFTNIEDKDLLIEAMTVESNPGQQEYNCKARIFLKKELTDTGKITIGQNALIYQMDSCFYLSVGSQRIYPSLVQPIAAGVKNMHEYLLEFQRPEGVDEKETKLIYTDKYINQRIYTLILQ